MSEYIEERNGGFWIRGSRISLDSIVYAFADGQAPESIARAFPVLNLEQVYGAIAYYLGNREAVDQHLQAARASYEEDRARERAEDPAFFRRLSALRQKQTAP